MNTEHLAKNYRHVSADTLIDALAFPIENVKGGFIIAAPFRAIARPIAGWLLNIIFDQGEKLHRRFLGNGEDQPQLPLPPADPEKAGAERTATAADQVFEVGVVITRWVDDEPQPGMVECELTDRFGKAWHLLEKSAVATAANITSKSSYPQPGVIYCHVITRGHDKTGREVAEIDTERTVVAEAVEGGSRFEVFADQLSMVRR